MAGSARGVEGRFQVLSVPPEEAEQGLVKLTAAYNDGVGNEDWSKWTPSGILEMYISNPPALQFFRERVGKVLVLELRDVQIRPLD